MTPRSERTFGRNTGYFEPPDLLILYFDHATDVSAAQAVVRTIYELGDAHGPLAVIVCIGKGYSSTPAARNVYSHTKRKYPIRYCAMVGSSFGIKVISSMIVRAARVLSPGVLEFPVEFFDTEEEARARIAALRAQSGRG